MKIPVENKGKEVLFVAGFMIPAGETVHIDEDQVPAHLKQKVAEVFEHPPIDVPALLEHPAAVILLAVPTLRTDDVAALLQAESSKGEDVRQELLQGLEAELKKRKPAEDVEAKARAEAEAAAAAKLEELKELASKAAKEVIAALPGLSNEDLGRLEQLEQARTGDLAPRKTVLEAITEETLNRAGGGSQG